MQALEKRIAVLESRNHKPCQWAWRNQGESDRDAMLRADVDPDAPAIVFSWRDDDAGY